MDVSLTLLQYDITLTQNTVISFLNNEESRFLACHMSFDQWPHFASLAIKKSLAHSVENWWEMTRSPLSTWTYHVTRPALRYRVIPAHTKHFCMTICCLLVCVMLLDHTKWHMTTCFKEDSYWMTFFYPLLSAVSAVSRWEIYSTTCFCTVGLFTVRAVIPMCFKSDN